MSSNVLKVCTEQVAEKMAEIARAKGYEEGYKAAEVDAKLTVAKFFIHIPRSMLVLYMGEGDVIRAEQFLGEHPVEVIRRYRDKNNKERAEKIEIERNTEA